MNHSAESFKLTQLRAKTDRQLLTLIARMLDRGLAHGSRLAARQIFAEASTLLAIVRDVSRAERIRLECTLAQLHELAGVCVRAACS